MKEKTFMKINKKAFTLVELLVVVLIIGILAAIAVPQYQYAVLKARYHTLMNITQAVKESQDRYFLQNGKYATHFSELDINMPGGSYVEPLEEDFEALNIPGKDFKIIIGEHDQILTHVYKDGELYMDYNVSLADSSVWGGAKALCVSRVKAGNLGQKVCNELTNAPESCYLNPTSQRYSCRIYQ